MIANRSYQCPKCGVEYRFRTTEQQASKFRCPKYDSNTIWQGRKGTDAELSERWRLLHALAVDGMTESEFQEWQVDTLALLSGCGCRGHWQTYVADHPPPFDADPIARFVWSWRAHDAVSKRINSEGRTGSRISLPARISLPQAFGIFRKSGPYETDLRYLDDDRVDVVIPYCDADRRFVREAIASIVESEHVRPTIHVVYDSPDERQADELQWNLPSLVEVRTEVERNATIHYYKTTHRFGPYRIANVIASQHAKLDYLALLDADDISTPDRLWRQLATLQRFGYEMTSGAMVNFVDTDDAGNAPLELRRQNEWVIESGVSFSHVPHGRCVNSVRTMRREMFLKLRGFSDAICSVDFDFDNRAHYAGVPIYWGTDVIGRRRLHARSLTNGPEFAHASANRQRSNRLVRNNLAKLQATPGFDTAASLGAIAHKKTAPTRVDAVS